MTRGKSAPKKKKRQRQKSDLQNSSTTVQKSFQNGKSDDKGALAIVKTVPQLGCVSRDSEPSELPKKREISGKPEAEVLGSIRRVRFAQSTLRQASSWKKKWPSLGKINVKVPHQRSPYAMKFEDRSHEGTERQQRCSRSTARHLAKNRYKLKEKDKATFYSPARERVLPAAASTELEEREARELFAIFQTMCHS